MDQGIIIFIVGLVVLLFGIGSFINPNLARFINLPGNAHIKAIIASIIGAIILIIGAILLL